MRIAQIAPLYEAVPPRRYGGTERIVSYLTEALVALGHDVTLFASGDSRTSARLVASRGQSLWASPGAGQCESAAHLLALDQVAAVARSFDVLHFHTEVVHFPLFESVAAHTVTTLHGRCDLEDLPAAYDRWPSFHLVSISDAQRVPLPRANWLATVYHGLPPELLRFTPNANQQYLAFLGRISPEKGVEHAISIAQRSNMPLRIAARIDPANVDYYRDVVKPLLRDPRIEYVGEIGDREKAAFLGQAAALVFPIEWPEPFGLVMIESMACGTPVIALRRDSVPEVIDEGVSGIVADTAEEAADAVPAALGLDRRRVRQVFERRFSAAAMTQRYLALYEQVSRGSSDPAPWRAAG